MFVHINTKKTNQIEVQTYSHDPWKRQWNTKPHRLLSLLINFLYLLSLLPNAPCNKSIISTRVSTFFTRFFFFYFYSHSPVQPNIRQWSIKGDHIASHQIELVQFEFLFHLRLLFGGYVDGLPKFSGEAATHRLDCWGGTPLPEQARFVRAVHTLTVGKKKQFLIYSF